MVRNESCVTIFHHCCSCIVKIQNVKWSFLHHMYLIVHYLCDQFCIRIVCESCQCTCMTVCLSSSHCIPCPKLLLMTQSFIKFCQKLEFISLINQKLVFFFGHASDLFWDIGTYDIFGRKHTLHGIEASLSLLHVPFSIHVNTTKCLCDCGIM